MKKPRRVASGFGIRPVNAVVMLNNHVRIVHPQNRQTSRPYGHIPSVCCSADTSCPVPFAFGYRGLPTHPRF